jgi:MoaA/NifB/PqqE/SkfB family radical SAM enzyme
VTENVARLQAERKRALSETPMIGISFVATKDTVASLPGVLRLGRRLGADRFLVSNLLAHTPKMREQALYHRSSYEPDVPPTERTPLVDLPRMELNEITEVPLAEVLKDSFTVSIAGQTLNLGSCTCPFAEKGSMSVRWDGRVSPCPPLMHGHTSWLGDRERLVEAYAVGDLASRGLAEIWNGAAFVGLREKLLAFDFAPCTICNGCEEAGTNRADCFGNTAPACGGCLWAQGFIRCP